MKWLRRWSINILLAVDQLGNALAGGDPDETISSRLGKIKRDHGGIIPWWPHPLAKVLDWCLERIDPNHSIDAIEHDEGGDAVVSHRPPTKKPPA